MSEIETCYDCGKQLPIKLARQRPDGTQEPLCQTCATRWLLSDEEFPPKKSGGSKTKTPIQIVIKTST